MRKQTLKSQYDIGRRVGKGVTRTTYMDRVSATRNCSASYQRPELATPLAEPEQECITVSD
jgi:hypothetical protein